MAIFTKQFLEIWRFLALFFPNEPVDSSLPLFFLVSNWLKFTTQIKNPLLILQNSGRFLAFLFYSFFFFSFPEINGRIPT
jgi:surface polysaccharide O-acyltransferase-like enzyme